MRAIHAFLNGDEHLPMPFFHAWVIRLESLKRSAAHETLQDEDSNDHFRTWWDSTRLNARLQDFELTALDSQIAQDKNLPTFTP